MKPVQVAILVVAAAIGGAVVMRVWQRPRAVPAAPAQVAQVPVQPAAEAPPQATPAAEPSPAAVAPPALAASRSERVARAAKPAAPGPSEPAIIPTPAAAAPPEPPKEATQPAPPPPETPPARTEPEQATPPPPPPAPEPHRVTLNAGLPIPVRLVDGLSSERNKPGDTFLATLDKELVVDGFVIAERGARVDGRVVAAGEGGKVKGLASLVVEFTRLRTADGQNIAIRTDTFERQAEATHQQDAAKVGAGAALGAIIGAVAGGGKGAAIGAGAGGAAGVGGVLLTRGKPATLPSETKLSLRLRTPVTITERVY